MKASHRSLLAIAAGAALLAASCATGAGLMKAGGAAPGLGETAYRPACVLVEDVRADRDGVRVRWLSDYVPGLRDGPGDSAVYIIDSGLPGGTLLVVGGTHANEIAGMTAATMLAERARPTKGRLIVIPHLNSSGLSYGDADNPRPSWIRLEAASGVRYLRYGSRFVHPIHQGQTDPARYLLPGGLESLPGEEQRNINRAYPGLAEGNLTQMVAAAVMAMLNEERVDVAVDMHEARPASKLRWMIVSNPKCLDIAIGAIFALEDEGIDMKLDRSSTEFRGLSHREWGDGSGAAAFLVETVNPAQAAGVPVDQLRDPEFPLWKRVAVQLEALRAIADAYGEAFPDGEVRYDGVPGYAELEARGLEAFF